MVLSCNHSPSLPVTWQATLKPYKHQIKDLGRVDIVICAEKFFLTGGPGPYPTYHVMIPAAKNKFTDSRRVHAAFSTA